VGYNVKIQKVERPTNTSFYVNFPAAIAEAAEVQKGETMEWLVEDRNTFILKRGNSSGLLTAFPHIPGHQRSQISYRTATT
jgi:hypothetical protein